MPTLSKYTSVFRSLTLVIAAAALLSGCSFYKINILQGNFLDQKKVDQVEQGMTRNQVKFLLGTPMIADVFNKDRWDYVFYVKDGRSGTVSNRKVTVYFDGDKVREIQKEDAPEESTG